MRFLFLLGLLLLTGPAGAAEPVPDKLVVLTFDDSIRSHFTVVRPILLKYKFGATFYVTEGFDFKSNKKDYMTWDQIAQLHKDGFEIGNHTRDHKLGSTPEEIKTQIEAINQRCREHGIPRTTTLAYPGNQYSAKRLDVLRKLGIRFARRGGSPEYPYKEGRGVAYEPGLDHPLLIPSAGDARPNWTTKDFQRAVRQARLGRIAVLQFHGVPDTAHAWVHTPRDKFEHYMRYLAENQYKVIALGDLEKYVPANLLPANPLGAIEDRKRAISAGKSRDNFRRPKDDVGLAYWLDNMVRHHRFSETEVSAATGLGVPEIRAAIKKFKIARDPLQKRPADAPLLTLPYPGGRHPRIGFRDGAIRPQRETKVSVFTPWDRRNYVVLDIPEAIWWNRPGDGGRELLYLAHTHIDTAWSRKKIVLEPLEWQRISDGTLRFERRLPNGVVFGAKVVPEKDAVRLEMWLTNGTDKKLTGLAVQNCVMLAAAPEFAGLTRKNKVFSKPYVACRSSAGNRWVITAWESCHHPWANDPCPCMHSDPKFPDTAPGETKQLRGWLSFYEGADVQTEFRRIDATGWRAKE